MRDADARRAASIIIRSSMIFSDGGIGRLYDKDVGAANILVNLNENFSVGESLDLTGGQLDSDVTGDLLRQRTIANSRQ